MHRSDTTASPAVEVVPAFPVPPVRARGSATARRVRRAFAEAIDHALAAAIASERTPQESLRTFRRAVRHARAIVATCRTQLPASIRLELLATFRAVTRATGAMRDRDALPAVLAELAPLPAAAEARARLEGLLLTERLDARRPQKRARKLAVAAVKLAALVERFERSLPGCLQAKDVEHGWKRLARKARSAVRAARREPSDPRQTHDARKRLRTLASALLALGGDQRRTVKRAQRLARIVTELGRTLDCQRLDRRARSGGIARSMSGGRELLEQLADAALASRPRLLKRAARQVARRRWKATK
ncbi:MAG: CHAD domain-containing protein [Planctomycetes bacterium]|nr:CHAD domain-containing protein [Planctomycetota bacterium]